ncbi:MAG: Mg(2+) transport ATPase protein [Bacteriovoracaceae bacterium]|nr:Mg(2+) transport ATPase protein [Bacteriovoracaceae bacterium]
MPITHLELISRIILGAILGGIIGFERDRHGRQVGFRTHLIVAMTAATFMVISAYFVYFQDYDSRHHVEVDASRIAASVVSGIGFLAGGAILRSGLSIQGITTAAGLWLVTAIGMCSGAGMYIEAISVTVLGLTALTVLRRFENKDDRMTKKRISIVLDRKLNHTHEVADAMKEMGLSVLDVEYQVEVSAGTLALDYNVQCPIGLDLDKLIGRLEAKPGLLKVKIQSAV